MVLGCKELGRSDDVRDTEEKTERLILGLALLYYWQIPFPDARFDGGDNSIKGRGCQTRGPTDFFNLFNGFDEMKAQNERNPRKEAIRGFRISGGCPASGTDSIN